MSHRPLQFMLALLMAVPLHLCCWAGLMKTAADEQSCMACHQFLTEAERQALPEPAPARHCECCDDTLLRGLTPDVLAAPQLVLRELTFYLPPDEARQHLPAAAESFQKPRLTFGRPPPGVVVPLYQLQCSRLI